MDLIDLIFPKNCLGCKKSGKYICETCLNKIPPVRQICPVCHRASIDGFTHPKCVKPQGMDGLVVLWPYGGIIRRAIISLKYKHAKEISKELSIIVSQKVKNLFVFRKEKAIITTVPLFWIRKNVRGYNQVDEIGKTLAGEFNFNFYPDLLKRKKHSEPQVSLKKEDREKNIIGVFKLNPRYKSVTKNSYIVIIDDVYTTGSTLKEAAKVLKRNGAGKVWGLTIAK